jgi:hypothetical protein
VKRLLDRDAGLPGHNHVAARQYSPHDEEPGRLGHRRQRLREMDQFVIVAGHRERLFVCRAT